MTTPLPPGPGPQSSEPALKIGAVVTVATAAIGAAVVFGADKEQAEQLLALVAALAAAAPLVTAVWTRFRVWSPASVAELLKLRRPERLP